MLSSVPCIGAVISLSDANACLETADRYFLVGARFRPVDPVFLQGHRHTPTRVTLHVELSPSPALHPLSLADVLMS